MKRTRRNHKPTFKAQVAMVAVKGDETISELAEQFGVQANYNQTWRRQLVDNAYVESLFRTCKYRPEYPLKGVEDINSAHEWVLQFIHYYHRYSGLKFMTPNERHTG